MIEILSNPIIGGSRIETVEFPGLQDSDIVTGCQIVDQDLELPRLVSTWTHSFDSVIPSGYLKCEFSGLPASGLVIKATVNRG